MRTLVKGGTVVGYADGGHHVIENGKVVFEGNDIVHVGDTYAEDVDLTIDASGKLVIPGLINMHAHITDTPYTGELLVDHGHHDWRDVLYKYLPAVRGAISAEDEFIAAECAFAGIDALRHYHRHRVGI